MTLFNNKLISPPSYIAWRLALNTIGAYQQHHSCWASTPPQNTTKKLTQDCLL